MKIFAIPILLLALTGCGALGSHRAEQMRAEDVGATVGGIIEKTVPGIVRDSVGPIIQPLTELARREAERRAANTPEDEGLDLWTQILLGIGGLGGVFTVGKSATRSMVAKAKAA